MSTKATVKMFDPALIKGFAPGTWVAISPDQERVVGSGNTIEEALEDARRNGEREQPFIYGIPDPGSALIL